MSNIGDGMANGLIEVGKDKCPICEKAPHPERTTTDKKDGKGCLESIPSNLGCPALPLNPMLPRYTTAAHHLIPANQCLKAFGRLRQMCECVGYDVNNSNNGLALPTCGQQALNDYAKSGGSTGKYGRLDDQDKTNAAFAIMDGLKLQWHVGHHDWKKSTDDISHLDNYDRLVKARLRALEEKFQKQSKEVCDPEDGKESGRAVIDLLNSLSKEICVGVVGWKIYFVSAMSARFAVKYFK